MNLQPTSPEELQTIVRSNTMLLPVGGGSKPALSSKIDGVCRLNLSRLKGIIEYEPGEYTFTAYAGTPVRDVQAALAEHGQYLPFDPLLVAQGATLGGVVAANTSGSGRYRYGGVRDFIIGVRFVDGQGQLVRGGGKVVKNSAGFDLPKFMVGSLGRFGIFVDLSFKVFPEPRAYVTLKNSFSSPAAALETIYRLFTAPYEMDALDLEPLADNRFALLIRLGGLPEALPGRLTRLQNFLQAETRVEHHEIIEAEAEARLWQQINGLNWAPAGQTLVKVPLAPRRIPLLENILLPSPPVRRYTAGGNVAWIATNDIDGLDDRLGKLGLSGLALLGAPGRPVLGLRQGLVLARRVKQALDPDDRFLAV